jgi:hypothetical protein
MTTFLCLLYPFSPVIFLSLSFDASLSFYFRVDPWTVCFNAEGAYVYPFYLLLCYFYILFSDFSPFFCVLDICLVIFYYFYGDF